MTADQGLYMLARHGGYSILGRMLYQAPVMGSDAILTILMLPHLTGRCAELLKEVSPLLARMKPLLVLLDPDPAEERSSIPPLIKTTNNSNWQLQIHLFCSLWKEQSAV